MTGIAREHCSNVWDAVSKTRILRSQSHFSSPLSCSFLEINFSHTTKLIWTNAKSKVLAEWGHVPLSKQRKSTLVSFYLIVINNQKSPEQCMLLVTEVVMYMKTESQITNPLWCSSALTSVEWCWGPCSTVSETLNFFLNYFSRRPALDIELIIRLVINKSSPKFTNSPPPIQQARTFFNYAPLLGEKSNE